MTIVPTLRDALDTIPNPLRRAVSHIIITPAADGRTAEVLASIALMVPAGSASSAGRYDVTIDETDMPEGVAISGWVRYPDQYRTISLETPPTDHIAGLAESGMVGTLDVAQIGERWHLRTHAGSDEERLTWLQSLPGSSPTSTRETTS